MGAKVMVEFIGELIIKDKSIKNVPQLTFKNGSVYRTFEVEMTVLDIYDFMKENNLSEFDYNEWSISNGYDW